MPVGLDPLEGEEDSWRLRDSYLPSEGPEAPKSLQVDGGVVAWLQVLGAFCLSFSTWYLLTSDTFQVEI